MDILTIQVIANLATTVALLVISYQTFLVLKVHKQNHIWNRRIEAQRFLDSYNQLEHVFALDDEFDFTSKEDPLPLKEIQDKLKDNRKLKLQLYRLLNYYESLAIGIKMKIYDEKVVRETRMASMIKTYRNFEQFIEYERNKDGNLYIYFKKCVEDWREDKYRITEEVTIQ